MSAPQGYGQPQGYTQVANYTPEQSQSLNQLLEFLNTQGGAGGQGFQQAIEQLMGIASGSSESFDAIEAPARRNFREQTIPEILQRITSDLGAGGGRATGEKHLLGGAGVQLEEGLAAQKAGMMQNAIQTLLSTYLQGQGLALGARPFGHQQDAPEPKSFWARLGAGTGGAAKGGLEGAAIGAPLGPHGAAIGGTIGAIGGGVKSFFD